MFKLSNHCFDQILFIVGPVISSRWTMPMAVLATTVLAMLLGAHDGNSSQLELTEMQCRTGLEWGRASWRRGYEY